MYNYIRELQNTPTSEWSDNTVIKANEQIKTTDINEESVQVTKNSQRSQLR